MKLRISRNFEWGLSRREELWVSRTITGIVTKKNMQQHSESLLNVW
jgi:hypothetical protein